MAKPAHLIAQAAFNENADTFNGKPGEQSGMELNACPWYSYPWDYIWRATREEDREYIADFMEQAVANGFIGYDTNKSKRDTLYEALTENGYLPEAVDTSCFCDCTSLIYCAIFHITQIPYSVPPENEWNVAKCPRGVQLDGYLTEQGPGLFQKLTDDAYTQSPDKLLRGDILVNSKYHWAVWI